MNEFFMGSVICFPWQKCLREVLYLLILAHLVICSPIPPQLSPTVFSSHNGGASLSPAPQVSSRDGGTFSDIHPSQESYVGAPKTTPVLTSPTGSAKPYPEVRVTSEVRTVSLQIAEGGVPMMKHMIHPLVFGKPEEAFIEPTEIEAPDATPTASSLVTSIPSKVVFVSPSPSNTMNKSDKESHETMASSVNGSPQNITILNDNQKPTKIIPIIKSSKDSQSSDDPDKIEKESPIDTGAMGMKSGDIILDVSRDKRIFPSKKENHTDDSASQASETRVVSTSHQTHKYTSPLSIKPNDSRSQNSFGGQTFEGFQVEASKNLSSEQISPLEPIKLEPRQANSESYFATEDPIEDWIPTEQPELSNGKTTDKQEDSLKNPSTEEIPVRTVPVISENTKETIHSTENANKSLPMDLNESKTLPIMRKEVMDSAEKSIDNSEEVFNDDIPLEMINGHEHLNLEPIQIPEPVDDFGSTESYRISAVKGRSNDPHEPREVEEHSQFPQADMIAEDLPGNNAHLIPGVLNSRSLEPLIDSFDQESSSVAPNHKETPVSEQIKEPIINPILMGFSCLVFIGLFLVAGFGCRRFIYKHSGIRPKHLTDRSCSNSDSGGYFDDQCRVAYVNSQLDVSKATPDDLVSLDNDSFLNSLESMTIQNLWTDSIRHTKL